MDDDEAIKRASGKHQAARFELEHVRSGYDKGWRSPAELAAAEEALYMARVDLEKLQALRAAREACPEGIRLTAVVRRTETRVEPIETCEFSISVAVRDDLDQPRICLERSGHDSFVVIDGKRVGEGMDELDANVVLGWLQSGVLEDLEAREGEARHAAKIEAEFEAREDSELWQMLLDYGVTGEGKTLRAGISEALSILEHRVANLATALERSGVDPSAVGVCGTCFGRGTETFGFPCQACGGTGQAAAAVARAR